MNCATSESSRKSASRAVWSPTFPVRDIGGDERVRGAWKACPHVAVLSEISRDEALDDADRAYLTAVLKKHNGVIASAARQAGLSRQGLSKLLKRHGIEADDFR